MLAIEIVEGGGEEEGRMMAIEVVGGEEEGSMLSMEVVGRGEEEG